MEEKKSPMLNDQELNGVSGGTGSEDSSRLYQLGERVRFHNVIAWDPNKTKPDTLDGTIYHVYENHPAAGSIYKYFYGVEYEYEGIKDKIDLVEQQIICSLG